MKMNKLVGPSFFVVCLVLAKTPERPFCENRCLHDVHHVRKVHVNVAMCFAPDCIMQTQTQGSECELELRGPEIDVWSKTWLEMMAGWLTLSKMY